MRRTPGGETDDQQCNEQSKLRSHSKHGSLRSISAAHSRRSECIRGEWTRSVADRVADYGASHAMTAAAATAELSSDERDYLDAFLAQQHVGVPIGIPSPPSKRGQRVVLDRVVPPDSHFSCEIGMELIDRSGQDRFFVMRRPKQRIEGNAAVDPAARVSRKYRVWQRR